MSPVMYMTQKQLPLGCVVLSAGAAGRFGENKLLAELGGKSLIRRTLETVPAEIFSRVAVVTGYDEIRTLAEEFGFVCVRNDRPERGQSLSVRLGVEAVAPVSRGILFMVADQPLLRRESVVSLIEAWQAHPDYIVSAAGNGIRGNPCVFPERFFPELCALDGDVGGGAVIRRHRSALLLHELPAAELLDADTPAALEAIRNIYGS